MTRDRDFVVERCKQLLDAKAMTDKCDRWDFDPSTPRILAATEPRPAMTIDWYDRCQTAEAELLISDGLLADAKADNERLRAENQRLNDRVATLVELRKFDHAEVEHLRTTIGYLADNIDNPALVAVAEAALKPKP